MGVKGIGSTILSIGANNNSIKSVLRKMSVGLVEQRFSHPFFLFSGKDVKFIDLRIIILCHRWWFKGIGFKGTGRDDTNNSVILCCNESKAGIKLLFLEKFLPMIFKMFGGVFDQFLRVKNLVMRSVP